MRWLETLQQTFPEALPFTELHERSRDHLCGRGLTPENTLFANATCRDEINKRAVDMLGDFWGENFFLSGLGGYPSGGKTAFGAFSHHVPDDGYMLILYGSHLGVSREGELGRVRRPGMRSESQSCGALLGFLDKLRREVTYSVRPDPLDTEQNALETALLPDRGKILAAASPILEITGHAYRTIEGCLDRIVASSRCELPLVLLGGVIINTPLGEDDWFAPRRFEHRPLAYDGRGAEDLLHVLRAPRP